MKRKPVKSKTVRRKRGATNGRSDTWALRLYVAGKTPKSATALRNLRLICEDQMQGKYRIEVIDLLERPRLAREHQILAIPTVVRMLPRPLKSVIGDLSNTVGVLVGLELVGRGMEQAEPASVD